MKKEDKSASGGRGEGRITREWQFRQLQQQNGKSLIKTTNMLEKGESAIAGR